MEIFNLVLHQLYNIKSSALTKSSELSDKSYKTEVLKSLSNRDITNNTLIYMVWKEEV